MGLVYAIVGRKANDSNSVFLPYNYVAYQNYADAVEEVNRLNAISEEYLYDVVSYQLK